MTSLLHLTLFFGLLLGIATSHAAGPVTGQGTWETTLLARDVSGHAVALSNPNAAFFYETTTNLTWLADMNSSGSMTWNAAIAWADSLTVGGFTDWRLPTIAATGNADCQVGNVNPNVCGYNVPGQVGNLHNEMAFLYYSTLGNLAYCAPGTGDGCTTPQPGWGLTNAAYFRKMQTTFYWSDTAYPAFDAAWGFSPFIGSQGVAGMAWAYSAVAVRNGDVLAVPEPHNIAMLIFGLVGIMMYVHRCGANKNSLRNGSIAGNLITERD